ncbi:Putative neutral zinc metallopeptidase [Allokutzneria albata]|uniref:Putative neutral zinc metallopeptidase n=2 Tax=Allokutzneria albata TaxID=211114 RepID=A0A1G9XPJ7_ALLAB|nr:Putative neutral zinc metallopeptidase [Allokutzneria albata]
MLMGAARRRAVRVTTLLAALLLAAGCTTVIRGEAKRVGAVVDPGSAAGLKVTEGPSGPRVGAADAQVTVENADNGEMDRLAINAVSDVQKYWAEQFPVHFGKPYEPLRRLASWDSGGKNMVLCRSNTAGVENAFFCPSEDLIAWDRGGLLPMLSTNYGSMAVVAVLAHEVGHAVGHRSGVTKLGMPTIIAEQQADCFTGAFFRHVAEGKAEHFEISTGDGLSKVLGAMFALRDQVGASFTKRGAHGNAFDRVTAFQFGFGQGPKRCAAMDAKDINARVTEYSFAKQDDNKGNLPVNEQTVKTIVENLQAVHKDTGAAPPEVSFGGTCASAEAAATYCESSNTVGLNMERLAQLGKAPAKQERARAIGDFAAFGEIASRYVISVQKAVGLKLSGDVAALRTACMVGNWAGSLLQRPVGGRNPVGTLRISPGDLDEAVTQLLTENTLMAADVGGKPVPSGFARVEAFHVGFLDGISACTEDFR